MEKCKLWNIGYEKWSQTRQNRGNDQKMIKKRLKTPFRRHPHMFMNHAPWRVCTLWKCASLLFWPVVSSLAPNHDFFQVKFDYQDVLFWLNVHLYFLTCKRNFQVKFDNYDVLFWPCLSSLANHEFFMVKFDYQDVFFFWPCVSSLAPNHEFLHMFVFLSLAYLIMCHNCTQLKIAKLGKL